jgi:hypothetical protein
MTTSFETPLVEANCATGPDSNAAKFASAPRRKKSPTWRRSTSSVGPTPGLSRPTSNTARAFSMWAFDSSAYMSASTSSLKNWSFSMASPRSMRVDREASWPPAKSSIV